MHRLGPGRRAPVMAVSLAVVVGLVLWLGHGGVTSATAAALLIAAVGVVTIAGMATLLFRRW